MIVRTVDDFHYLVRQPEHARMSAVLAAALRPEFVGATMQDYLDVLRATHDHDVGWAEWEEAPALQPSGLPVNFPDIDRADHRENWTRTIFTNLRMNGAAAALYTARHMQTLDDVKDASAREERDALLAALQTRAFPGLPEDAAITQRERGFNALFLCDALSLTALAGWEHTTETKLIGAEGAESSIRMWRDGDWTVRVDPWPFAPAELRAVSVEATAIPAGEERRAAWFLKALREARVRVLVDYLPVEVAR